MCTVHKSHVIYKCTKHSLSFITPTNYDYHHSGNKSKEPTTILAVKLNHSPLDMKWSALKYGCVDRPVIDHIIILGSFRSGLFDFWGGSGGFCNKKSFTLPEKNHQL